MAGATALNQDGPRFSNDIDIFQDREEDVARMSKIDTSLLLAKEHEVEWLRQEPGIYAVIVKKDRESTKLEWVRDNDFRFFPVVKDDLFGYRLHIADLATNKALAAAGREEPRGILDLLYIHDHYLPLGAVIWAAVAKDLRYSPESLISEIKRNARYLADDYAALALIKPVDAASVSRQLRSALEPANTFVRLMPSGKEGLLFLKDGEPAQPNPENLSIYEEQKGCRKGLWPSSSEISSAMLYHNSDDTK